MRENVLNLAVNECTRYEGIHRQSHVCVRAWYKKGGISVTTSTSHTNRSLSYDDCAMNVGGLANPFLPQTTASVAKLDSFEIASRLFVKLNQQGPPCNAKESGSWDFRNSLHTTPTLLGGK